MFMVLTEGQMFPVQRVCQGCLLADQGGQPRADRGRLHCGQTLRTGQGGKPPLYECTMGFQVANIED